MKYKKESFYKIEYVVKEYGEIERQAHGMPPKKYSAQIEHGFCNVLLELYKRVLASRECQMKGEPDSSDSGENEEPKITIEFTKDVRGMVSLEPIKCMADEESIEYVISDIIKSMGKVNLDRRIEKHCRIKDMSFGATYDNVEDLV